MLNSTPTFDHVTITNSSTAGIIATSSVPTIVNCSFAGNVSGLVNTTPGTVITAKLCYWNHASGPSGAGSGSGQSATSGTLVEPWLKTAFTSPEFATSAQFTDKTFNPTIGINFVLSMTSSITGNWQLNVFDSASSLVRTITATGSTVSLSWDGKNDAAVLLSNGNYTYETLVTDSNNNVSASAKGAMTLDTTKQLTISNFSLTPAFFSPDGNSIQDNTALSAGFSFDQANYTINIRNSSNAIVKTVTGTAAAMAYSWDGKDSNSVLQSDGLYGFELIVTDGTATATASASATLDNTFPTSIISSPTQNATVSNVYQNASTNVDLIGTADDVNLNNWDLQRAPDTSPTTWTAIGSGTTAIQNALLSTWATAALANGGFTLRLRVWDKAGNLSTVLRPVTLGNFSMSQNVQQANLSLGQSVTYTSIVPFQLAQTINIKDVSGQIVKVLFSGTRPAGTYQDIWYGTRTSGSTVGNGGYFYSATAGVGGSTMSWDLSTDYWNDVFRNLISGNGYLTVNHPFDIFGGHPMTFTYNLTLPSQLTITFSNQDMITPGDCAFPQYCKTINAYQGTGWHTASWGGVDNAGVARPDTTHVLVTQSRRTFAKNAVVIFGTAPEITNLSLTPSTFSPYNGSQTIAFDLTSYLSQAVDITVTLMNQSSNSVLKTITLNQHAPGHVTISWDGRADNSDLVAPDYYTVTIQVSDPEGNLVDSEIISEVQY